MPISDEAYEILGERKNDNDKVFAGLKKWDVDRVLPVWVAKAGITKHITFHCFRHTYATLQIFSGTDIFTLSKMLGHKSVKTTQIYTKIVDEKKREASMRISLK
jgi:site-specific recombinase XerD